MKTIVSLLLLLCSFAVAATQQATALFADHASSLYQIRLIENASGEKSSIGSGFQISANGLIATNYHVISGYALHPDKYQLEFLDVDGNKGALTLESIDVINDLALVKHLDESRQAHLQLSTQPPEKGEEIYSLGNPHDLGMIVVPGTYNGIKSESFNPKIHFTGSVNPGMSGGPVVNKRGQVVGINVATSGNQIGFLVPQDKLIELAQRYQLQGTSDISEDIRQQLLANQQRLLGSLLEAQWAEKSLGRGIIPQIDVPFIRCWGDSNADKKDDLFFTAVSSCTLDEDIFISDSFYSGTIEMQFRWMETEKLNPLRFYHLYEKQIGRAGPDNKASKQDVSEFSCQHNKVATEFTELTSKTIYCVRAYKQYPDLYDVMFLAASIDKDTQALISHFTLSGVSKELSQAFAKRFMGAVKWN